MFGLVSKCSCLFGLAFNILLENSSAGQRLKILIAINRMISVINYAINRIIYIYFFYCLKILFNVISCHINLTQSVQMVILTIYHFLELPPSFPVSVCVCERGTACSARPTQLRAILALIANALFTPVEQRDFLTSLTPAMNLDWLERSTL